MQFIPNTRLTACIQRSFNFYNAIYSQYTPYGVYTEKF